MVLRWHWSRICLIPGEGVSECGVGVGVGVSRPSSPASTAAPTDVQRDFCRYGPSGIGIVGSGFVTSPLIPRLISDERIYRGHVVTWHRGPSFGTSMFSSLPGSLGTGALMNLCFGWREEGMLWSLYTLDNHLWDLIKTSWRSASSLSMPKVRCREQ